MKIIVLQILAIFIFTISISAQSKDNQPELVDEFGNVSLEDRFARMDGLAFQIEQTPNSKALVRVYGGDQRNFASPYVYGSVMRSMWNTRRYSPEKLTIQFCNVNNEPFSTKLFKVRENEKVENCDENLTVPKETIHFESVSFFEKEFKLKPWENDGFDVVGSLNGEYSQFARDVLKKFLNDSRENKVYVIAYRKTNFETDDSGKVLSKSLKNLDPKSFADKMMRNARNNLIKSGIPAKQIVVMDGGFRNSNERELEFWFVPKGGEIPKAKPDYVPKKKLAKK